MVVTRALPADCSQSRDSSSASRSSTTGAVGALKAFSGETIVRSNALVGSACAPPSQPPASAGLLRYFEPSANREFQVLLVKLLESHRIRVRVKPAHEGAIRIREIPRRTS